MTKQKNLREFLLHSAGEIESEMKSLGIWSDTDAPSHDKASGAFGYGSLSFEEWLQFVFVPGLKHAARTGDVHGESDVAVAAIRNLDGIRGVERLIDLIAQVDAAVSNGSYPQ
jgi:uncharacterized protein YqcC (DUF446 family)